MKTAKAKNSLISIALLIAIVLIMAIGLARGAKVNDDSRHNEMVTPVAVTTFVTFSESEGSK